MFFIRTMYVHIDSQYTFYIVMCTLYSIHMSCDMQLEGGGVALLPAIGPPAISLCVTCCCNSIAPLLIFHVPPICKGPKTKGRYLGLLRPNVQCNPVIVWGSLKSEDISSELAKWLLNLGMVHFVRLDIFYVYMYLLCTYICIYDHKCYVGHRSLKKRGFF